jgi:hypothetical protein
MFLDEYRDPVPMPVEADTPVAGLLKAGRARIDKGWTKGALARNADWVPVEEYDGSAVAFCAIGAISSAAREHRGLLGAK